MFGGMWVFIYCVIFTILVSLEFGVGVIWQCQQNLPYVTISENLKDNTEIKIPYWVGVITFWWGSILRYFVLFKPRFLHFRPVQDSCSQVSSPCRDPTEYERQWFAVIRFNTPQKDPETTKVGFGKGRVVVGWRTSLAMHWITILWSIAGIMMSFFSGMVVLINTGQVGTAHDVSAWNLAVWFLFWALCQQVLQLYDSLVYVAWKQPTYLVSPPDAGPERTRDYTVDFTDFSRVPWPRLLLHVVCFVQWTMAIISAVLSKFGTDPSVMAQWEYSFCMLIVIWPIYYALTL